MMMIQIMQLLNLKTMKNNLKIFLIIMMKVQLHLAGVNWVQISVVLTELFCLNNYNILWRLKGMQAQENILWQIIILHLG